jgi:hypothetical protein
MNFTPLLYTSPPWYDIFIIKVNEFINSQYSVVYIILHGRGSFPWKARMFVFFLYFHIVFSYICV